MASGDCVGSVSEYSEEYFTHECDICKQDDIRKQATVYCPECEEYLCKTCQDWHRKSKASKSHLVQTVLEAKYSSNTTQSGSRKNMRNLCICNQQKDVLEFCLDHKEFICSVCAKIKHRRCKKETIDELSRDESAVSAFDEIANKVNGIVQKASELKSDHTACLETLEDTEKCCRLGIHDFTSHLINWLKKLEEDALADLHEIIEKEKKKLKEGVVLIESVAEILNADKHLIDETKQTQDKRQIFITSQQIQKSLLHYDAALVEAKGKLVVPDIKFVVNKELTNIEHVIACLGHVKAASSGVFPPLHCTGSETVCIDNNSDSLLPCISGISLLKNDELLVTDYRNSRLTLLDRTLKVKESIKCTGRPWDIAVVDDQEIIVSFPDKKMLQYYTVTPNLQAGRTIQMDGGSYCWGVAVTSDRIYVSRYCDGTPDILELDRSGKLLSSKTAAETGINFKCCYYITANYQGNKLYLSDYHTNQLICMSTEGKHLFSYSDPDLQGPRGVIVDADENIMVCGENSNNIHVIKPDGKGNKLLSFEDGIKNPCGIEYSLLSGKLFIGGLYYNEIKVYSFK